MSTHQQEAVLAEVCASLEQAYRRIDALHGDIPGSSRAFDWVQDALSEIEDAKADLSAARKALICERNGIDRHLNADHLPTLDTSKLDMIPVYCLVGTALGIFGVFVLNMLFP